MAGSIPVVLSQFVEDAVVLRHLRSTLVRAPHVTLEHLNRFDQRLAAHLDGLAVGGDSAWQLCRATLETIGAAQLFVVAVAAIENDRRDDLGNLFKLARVSPDAARGLISALGWVEGRYLQGIVANLLTSREPFHRTIGIAACATHRVDPDTSSSVLRAQDPDPSSRARGLRLAGELGRVDLGEFCSQAVSDADSMCRYWGSWAAVILGDRHRGLKFLASAGTAPEVPAVQQMRAFTLVLQASTVAEAHALLQALPEGDPVRRLLIKGCGVAGDPRYVPWLIDRMNDVATARIAGEAFSLITGADLLWLDLERPQPELIDSGPNDDPDDQNVALDDDESLPWPDVAKIEQWWAANQSRFHAGTRYFMGAPVSREHCIEVLKTGYQRQRILAAQYLCLLEPGTPLFNTSAPAWRQQRWLDKMS